MKPKRSEPESFCSDSLPPKTQLVVVRNEDIKTSKTPRTPGFRPWGKRDVQPSSDDYRLLTMVALLLLLGIFATFLTGGRSQLPSRPIVSPPKGTSFLDHDAPIAGFPGRAFLKDNIPFIDIPDKLIQDVYYYRWSSLQHNLRFIMQEVGWMCTEFVHPVWYASAYGAIDAAAGHHIDEMRWLRSTYYADDYFQLYARGPANSTQYTQWILDAANRRSMVTGDTQFLSMHLDDMVNVWQRWDSLFDKKAGLYYVEPVWDAQELSLPGWIVDPNGTIGNLRYDGPYTYRPSHNAYMTANARAISRAAKLARNKTVESNFTKLADDLESSLYSRLWDPVNKFFMDVIRPDNPGLKRLTGRQQVGLFPFRFGIGLDEEYAQPAVDAMFDREGFLAPYGPTTLEIRDPWFMGEKPDDRYCCYWNGMSWPYSTSHTLKSLAAIYRAGTTNVTAEHYYQYLRTYAKTQQKDHHPYIAESHYPFRDAWAADSTNHSEHYAHSTYNDDIITGLLGILPQADDILVVSPIVPHNWTYFCIENLPYHGRLVTVIYDKDGSRYKEGRGLTIFIDGKRVHSTREGRAEVPMIPSLAEVTPSDGILMNIAANPLGMSAQYPKANATYTNEADWVYKAIDGVLYYDRIPDNRWTNFGSPNTNDTVTVTFARPRNISSVTLALYSDVERGGSIDLPAHIEVYDHDGELLATVTNANDVLLANDRNEIPFNRKVETLSVAVNMYRKSEDLWVGICELEVWAPSTDTKSVYYAADTKGVHYAVDAHIEGQTTLVLFDGPGDDGIAANNTRNGFSKATPNGAVISGLAPDSNISFAGIVGPREGREKPVTLEIGYFHAYHANETLSIEINHNAGSSKNVTLPPTVATPEERADVHCRCGGGYKYGKVKVPGVRLGVGKNWVVLKGGPMISREANNKLRIETLTVVY